MKHIFFLSGDYIKLGKEEILSLLDAKNVKLMNHVLIADLDSSKGFERLALTKSVYRLLFECKTEDLIDSIKSFGWNSVYKKDFCLRLHNLDNNNPINKKLINEKRINNKSNNKNIIKINNLSEKKLAGYVWNILNNPKVNLQNPKTLIAIIISKGKAYCGVLVHENKEDFESRKSHLRPFPHPSSLHPKVARALVNLSEIKEKEILFDPFCGTGGFFIEAGLMNIKSIGYDISKMMAEGCIANLEHYKNKIYKIKIKDAADITDKFDCLVTDLPYGLNSNAVSHDDKKPLKSHRINKKIQKKDFVKDLEKFYLYFLKNLRKKLKKKSVIVFPSYVDYKKLLKKTGFKIEFEYSDYVHRSLTRKMVKVR
ncbi:MAG TPA: DNA methyltransferase [Candidatus Nanoarchaeia archaeon]|nr:DNA methyltransferase [Candidatus Nanoarchaeia archaeon]